MELSYETVSQLSCTPKSTIFRLSMGWRLTFATQASLSIQTALKCCGTLWIRQCRPIIKVKLIGSLNIFYLPNREDEQRRRAMSTPNGRTLFEYDPNFQLPNGQIVRMGMLLIEDRGLQTGAVDNNATACQVRAGYSSFNSSKAALFRFRD